jgi:N-acetylglucosaminyl-diphospho-decaprenol L-rhamnosyltransferase
MKTPRTSIIVVSYRSQPVIEQLLESLRVGPGGGTPAGDFEVVIVSNSGDCAPLERPGLVRVIDSGRNLGFGRACNLGAEHARGRVLLFCNPDVRMSPEIASALADVLEANPQCGIIAPYQNHDWSRCNPSGTLNPLSGTASGGCFAMLAPLYKRLGGFDGGFFLWYEDDDLTARVRAAGLQIAYADGLVVQHAEGHSTRPAERARRAFLTRVWLSSHYLCLLKHGGRPRALKWCLGMTGANLLRTLTGTLPDGRPYHLPSAAAGFGLRLLANLWRDKHFVSFDGTGFVWGTLPAEPRQVVIHPLEPAGEPVPQS